jgi:glutamine amidotransferase
VIGIIDYGSGNLRSVSKALQREGADVSLVGSPQQMEGIRAVVLPGVGAFGDCVRNLRERGLWEPLRLWLESGRHFLGICLGYQLLFETSEETPGAEGFGFFSGKVRRFQPNGLKVPHMGWNDLRLTAPADPLWRGVPDDPFVFFVHSYFPAPAEESIVTSHATYGETFAASVTRGNVSAVQFHPEKSQDVGLTILRNFVASVP